MGSNIFLSYIIPTIGRPSLSTAVQSVLEQSFPQAGAEIVVVNDSGTPLQNADWHTSPRVRIINTNKSERSLARNAGAAVANGLYVAFLDDDDWMLPGALNAFWHVAKEEPQAAWLYGGIRIVDESRRVLAEINSGLRGNCFSQIMGGAWAPLQASIIKARTFFEVGGFNPLICGTEDEDLARRMAYAADFANTPSVVACLYRGQNWQTSTNYLRAPEDTKYSRNLVLLSANSFRRLRSSADSSYWHGRVLHVYLSTFKWNIMEKRYFSALSRLFYSFAFALLSLRHIFARAYWAGLKADHVPETLHFVMKNNDRNAYYSEI